MENNSIVLNSSENKPVYESINVVIARQGFDKQDRSGKLN
jgi:hypothetical protein